MLRRRGEEPARGVRRFNAFEYPARAMAMADDYVEALPRRQNANAPGPPRPRAGGARPRRVASFEAVAPPCAWSQRAPGGPAARPACSRSAEALVPADLDGMAAERDRRPRHRGGLPMATSTAGQRTGPPGAATTAQAITDSAIARGWAADGLADRAVRPPGSAAMHARPVDRHGDGRRATALLAAGRGASATGAPGPRASGTTSGHWPRA